MRYRSLQGQGYNNSLRRTDGPRTGTRDAISDLASDQPHSFCFGGLAYTMSILSGGEGSP